MPSKPFLTVLCLHCSLPHPHGTYPVLGRCAFSASCLFSQSGLHSRCSSKCFLFRLFTILLQNRNCIRAIALQIFKEKTSQLPFHLIGNSPPFPPGHRCNLLEVCPIILLSSAPFSTARCLSLQPDCCIILF